jgi:hypothetical protein
MRGSRSAAFIMLGLIAMEGWPLIWIATEPGGTAFLGGLLGLRAPAIPPLAWALALLIALGYVALSARSLPFIGVHLFDLAALKLLAVPFALVTGTFEEFFFRRWIMNMLHHHGVSVLLQILASGIVFGAAHAVWGLLGRNLRAAALSMLFTCFLGLALAGLYILSNRQLAPAAWSHILINLLIEPWLILGVMQLRWPAQAPSQAHP